MIQFTRSILATLLLSLKEDIELLQLLIKKLGDKISDKQINLLYRASEHNFTSESYHKVCDEHESLITIIKSNYGNIFGGYSGIITSNHHKRWNKDNFIFLIRSQDTSQKTPLLFDRMRPAAAYDPDRGPMFYDRKDMSNIISIGNNCNVSALVKKSTYDLTFLDWMCYTQKGFGGLKTPISGGEMEESTHCFFKVIDYEVFEIQK